MTKMRLNYLLVVSAVAAISASWLRLETAFVLLKPLTTILIILIPVLFNKATEGRVVVLAVMALLACLAGDVFLLNDDYFVYGLSAFLIAHGLFTVIFYRLSDRRLYLLPLLVLLLFGGGFYSLLLPQLDDLAIPVAIYISCILLMCWRGIAVALSRRDKIGRYLCIAALLFVFSDSIIAINKFLVPFEFANAVILITYWASIAIIANIVPTAKAVVIAVVTTAPTGS